MGDSYRDAKRKNQKQGYEAYPRGPSEDARALLRAVRALRQSTLKRQAKWKARVAWAKRQKRLIEDG